MEKVRLVIWDLDETFWRGTVTEGGIEYLGAHHEIVIELARRGIVSSICSRNDFAQIEGLLRKQGLWEYFVFPSIDWTAKGPRLKAIVEASQLRAPTIMFIDDNPMNLAEATHFVEGIQVADPSIIPKLLGDPNFKGKDDGGLTRLAQYKLLERRALEMDKAPDSREFLRKSDIRVIIDHDIESHIDRAIELINRTNQLNFTKRRLPEDPEAARSELRKLINRFDIQAGLVRVLDRYGDYGYVGFYAHRKTVDVASELVHFCFSCRTLGMQVETWLYQRMGRPNIRVVGEVLTDILDPGAIVDWVRIDTNSDGHQISTAWKGAKLSRVFMRGGCEIVAVAHYFEVLTENLVGEFGSIRNRLRFRPDHSQMTLMALRGLSTLELETVQRLGYLPSDFHTAMTDGTGGTEIWILSFWADLVFPTYRHRELGFRIPFHIAELKIEHHEYMTIGIDALPSQFQESWIGPAIAELQRDYAPEGFTVNTDLFRQTVTEILQRLPPNAHAFVLAPGEKVLRDGVLHAHNQHVKHNGILRQIVDTLPAVTLLAIDDYIGDVDERQHDPNHFSRQVYFRLFEDVCRRIEELDLTKGDTVR